MKTKQKFLAMAAIALTFTACSSDNDNPANNDGKEYPISLSVGIGDLSVVTRAENTTLTSGDLGLYIESNGAKDTGGKYLCYNQKVSYSNNAWTLNPVLYWASDNAEISYVAYFPYKDLGSTPIYKKVIEWNVKDQATSTDTDYDKYDLLWKKSTATNTDNNAINITLDHVCSKLTVNVKRLGSEIDNNSVISEIKIGGMSPSGEFCFRVDGNGSNLGEWINLGSAENFAMKQLATATTGCKATYEAILIPQTALVSLIITLDNGYTYQLSIPSQEYQNGKHYTLNIQVGQDKVVLGTISQTPWENATDNPIDLTAQ